MQYLFLNPEEQKCPNESTTEQKQRQFSGVSGYAQNITKTQNQKSFEWN